MTGIDEGHGFVRPLNPLAAWFWGIWFFLGVLPAIYLFDSITYDRVVLTAFLLAELAAAALIAKVAVVAIRNADGSESMLEVVLRDTLSEVSTYVARMSKPGTPWWKGWNAAVVLGLSNVAFLAARVAAFGPGGPSTYLAFGVLVFVGLEAFLVYHFLRPEKYG